MQYFKSAVMGCLLLLATLNLSAWSDQSINTQLIRLETADGINLTGVLRQHHSASNGVGIVMVHGYSGNFYSGIMNFLPKMLADRGFATLAINMRDHDRSPKKNLFRENRLDIAAAVEAMARRGFHPLFLHGHSMGTNRVLYYLAATHDPRISGAMLTGAPGNLFEWNVRMFGKETATQVLRKAQDLLSRGQGDQWMLIDLGPLGKALYTASHLVSLRGPETVSDPFNNIARIVKPILIVHGLADRLADHTVADRLRNSAPPEAKVDVVKIAGAGHSLYNHQKDLRDTMSHWLMRQTKN